MFSHRLLQHDPTGGSADQVTQYQYPGTPAWHRNDSPLTQDAQQATSVGLLKSVNLNGIFDLTPLNSILTAADQPTVSAG